MQFKVEDEKVWLVSVNLTNADIVNKVLTIEIPQFVEAIDFKDLFEVDFDIANTSLQTQKRKEDEIRCLKLFFGAIHLVIVGNNNTLCGRFDDLGYVRTTMQDSNYKEALSLSKVQFKHFDARGFSSLTFTLDRYDFAQLNTIDINGMMLDKVNNIANYPMIYKGSPDYDWSKVDFSGLDVAYQMFKRTSIRASDIEQNFKQLRPKIQMKEMFEGCGSLQRIPDIGIQDCRDTTGMFSGSALHGELAFKNYKITSDLIYRESMFSNTRITRLVVDNFVFNTCTNNAAKFESMFNSCNYLQEVVIQNVQCENNPKSLDKHRACQVWLDQIFAQCTMLRRVIFRNIDLGNCRIEMTHMFLGCQQLESVELHNVRVDSFGVPYRQFEGCTKLSNVILDNVEVLHPTKLQYKEYKVSDNNKKKELENLFSVTPLAGQPVSKEYARLMCSNLDD